MQHWYLVKLTEEYVRSLAISKVDDEFKKIVEAVQDNKTIVDELEKIISQFKV